jgi:eukaryotic-like serine/threonine-protein kinase
VALLKRLPSVGDVIDRYRIVAEIGHGGMAVVFAARRTHQTGFDKLLALKTLHPQIASEPRFVDMFLDEARIAAHVAHPNVVNTFDVIDHDGLPMIVMELLRGQSLLDVLRNDPSLPRPLLYWILARAADGLFAAHTAKTVEGTLLGIVHRDVSPHNIHIGYDGQVKLVDFGIAAARGRMGSTRTGELKGKLRFIAPEQVSQGEIDHRTDLWALGVIAWETLRSERLFRVDDEASTLWNVIHKTVPSVRAEGDSIPSSIDQMVKSCLEREKDKRPASARDVARTFADASSGVTADDLAEYMCAQFAQQREDEEHRLRATDRKDATPLELSRDRDETQGAATGDIPIRVTRARALGLFTVLVVALLAGGTALWLGRESRVESRSAPSALPAALRTESPTSNEELPVSNPPRTIVTVHVDPGIKLVLVDGQQHDERPVVATLDATGVARVALVGNNGTMAERELTAANAHIPLSLTGSGATQTPPSKFSPKATPTTSAKSPLLGNPY